MFDGLVEEAPLDFNAPSVVLVQDRQQMVIEPTQPPHDLWRAGAIAADLGQAKLDIGRPPGGGHASARSAVGVDDERRPGSAAGELDQECLDPVEGLHGGGGVVDGRRQRADGDVDEHSQGERRVLIDRSLPGHDEHAARQRGLRIGPGAADAEHMAAGDDVFADQRHDLDETARSLGHAQQRGPVDGGDDRRRPL